MFNTLLNGEFEPKYWGPLACTWFVVKFVLAVAQLPQLACNILPTTYKGALNMVGSLFHDFLTYSASLFGNRKLALSSSVFICPDR